MDVSELNQRLVEEISSLQLKMIDILRENFRLKSELDTVKRSGGTWSVSGAVPMFSTIRKHRLSIPREETVCFKNHRHHHRGHNRLVAVYEDPLPGNYSSSASSWDMEEEMGDLNRRVEDMDRVVARLDAQTREHESLYQEYMKLGTSSGFMKQPSAAPMLATSWSMPSPARIPPRPMEVAVEGAPPMAPRFEIGSTSPVQSSTPRIQSGKHTPKDIQTSTSSVVHPAVEESRSIVHKGLLKRMSTIGMVIPDEPHALIGQADASSDGSKSVAEEF